MLATRATTAQATTATKDPNAGFWPATTACTARRAGLRGETASAQRTGAGTVLANPAATVAVTSTTFFKQKTAYGMALCAWSSDVCSSDLNRRFATLFANKYMARILAKRTYRLLI